MSRIYESMQAVENGAIDDTDLDFLISHKTLTLEEFMSLDIDLSNSTVEWVSEIFHAASMFKFQRTRNR